MIEIEAVYIRERLRFESSDGDTVIADIRLVNGSSSAFPDDDRLPVAVKGKADVDELQPHQTYRFYGRGWSDYTNKRTGQVEHQFNFQTFIRSQPHGRAGVISYIKQAGRGHGIGQARATKLWDKFGSDAVRILREEPEIAAAAVAGLSIDQAKEAAAWLEEEHALEGCTIDLIDLLSGRGFPKDTARKAVKKWGNWAAEIIKRDPYSLMAFRGAGFKRCDALWMELGLPASRLRRQALCAWYGIASNTDGHTYFPVEYCTQKLQEQIGGSDVRTVAAIKLARKIGQLSLDRNGALSTLRSDPVTGAIIPKGGKLWVAEGRKAWCEDKLAELIVNSFSEVVRWPDVSLVKGIDDHQREQLAKALQGTIGILGGSPGTGKAQPLDAKVLTPSGWKELGRICVGDLVYGLDGCPRAVVGVFPQGIKPVYRVEMSDGASTECTDDHLWYTRTIYERTNRVSSQSKGSVKPLKDIRTSVHHAVRRPNSLRWRNNHEIPITSAIQFPESDLPIHPYVFGVLIGDGSVGGGSVKLTSIDSEVIESVDSLLPEGFGVSRQGSSYKDWRISKTTPRNSYVRNPILDAYRNFGLYEKRSWEKFIPEAYKFASVDQRVELLQGLLDTDGYCQFHKTHKASAVEYTTTSKQLASDVTEIVEGLGGQARIRCKVPSYAWKGESRKGRTAFTVAIRLPSGMAPFRLSRKLVQYREPNHNIARRTIKSIVPAGSKECVCISVDAADGLYVTDRFIVTHNTYTASALIRVLVDSFGSQEVGIGAPTGKAACRMTELLQSYGLPLRARTWHSLLGIGQAAEESGNWGFKHNENEPLPFKVLIGDESSMLNTGLMSSIFRARAAGTLFLLVGDVNQLPPVGHGAPLRDLIAAGLPYGELREIKRNSGGIVEACAAIRDGRQWGAGDNLHIDEIHGEQHQVNDLLSVLIQAKADGFDPVWDCQVVVAVNAKSKLSRKEVNRILQAELNKNPEIKGSPFRLGDKIVNGKNGFFPIFDQDDLHASEDVQTNDRGECYVANGELAEVIDVAEKLVVAKLSNPARTIKIPRGRSQEESDSSQDDATGGDSDKTSTGCSWDLGYALSVHKSQGSEWPIVIVMVDEYPGARMITTKEFWYTAISRAKRRCVLIGKKATVDRGCRTKAIGRRKTFLRELIALKTAERTLVEL